MKIDLNFIPLNTVPKGVKTLAVYDENNIKVGVISLGNLIPKSEGDKLYTFGALSDVHLPYDTGPEDFIRALNYFNNVEKVNFICISGDMGSSGTDAEWANYKTHVDTYSPNTPVYISAGNHDAGTSSAKTYEYPITYTGNPLYYSFTQGDDVFIMFGMTFWGDPPFSDESLQWLYEILEENRNKRCFVFQHIMRKGHAGDASGRYPMDLLNNTNGQVFLSLMEHYRNVLWFHGHSHCEFEQQDTLALPNSNYDRDFGCHSIHVSSCCMTRNEDNDSDYEDSEGYVVDVYENGIHLRGRDFVAEKFLPVASYWIDTTLVEISEKSYVDSRGVIDTEENPEPIIIDGMEQGEVLLNQRWSSSSGAFVLSNGRVCIVVPVDVDSDTTCVVTISGASSTYGIINDSNAMYTLNADKTVSYTINGHYSFGYMTEGFTQLSDTSGTVTFTLTADMKYISITLVLAGSTITESDISNLAITVQIGGI